MNGRIAFLALACLLFAAVWRADEPGRRADTRTAYRRYADHTVVAVSTDTATVELKNAVKPHGLVSSARDVVPESGEAELADDAEETTIPHGMRVVTVAVHLTPIERRLVSPRDVVDLVVEYRSRGPEGGLATKTFLRDVEVFDTDSVTRSSDAEGERSVLLSVLVSTQDANVLRLAESMGELRLSPRTIEETVAVESASNVPLPVDVTAGEFRVVGSNGDVLERTVTPAELESLGVPGSITPRASYVVEAEGVTWHYVRVVRRVASHPSDVPVGETLTERGPLDDATAAAWVNGLAEGLRVASRSIDVQVTAVRDDVLRAFRRSTGQVAGRVIDTLERARTAMAPLNGSTRN